MPSFQLVFFEQLPDVVNDNKGGDDDDDNKTDSFMYLFSQFTPDIYFTTVNTINSDENFSRKN